MKAPLPPDEAQRLATLRQYEVLDTPLDQSYDDLALLAAHICQTPMAMVSFVDESRQWFKSKIGVTAAETSRDIAFCAHTILHKDEVFEVRDAEQDARFADSPLVTSDPHIRFYAGAPLVAPDGHALGALCVMDRAPRTLTAEQLAALRALSRHVVAQLELRRQARALLNEATERQRIGTILREQFDQLSASKVEAERLLTMGEKSRRALLSVLEDEKRAGQNLRESDEKFRQLAENIADVFYITSPDLQQMHYVSPAYEQIWRRSAARLYAHPHEWAEAILIEDRERVFATFGRLASEEPAVSVEFRIARPDGEVRWILSRGFQVRDAAGNLIRITGVATDITERKRAEAELEKTHRELLEASRQASLAEFANGVLHNVGNVLNSVNVATTCLSDSLKKSKSANLAKAVALMRQHETDLGNFFTHDPKGKQVPAYLAQLADHLADEHASALKELGELQKNVEHIKNIITVQQDSTKMSRSPEALKLADLVEDALKMNANGLTRAGIQVSKEFQEIPPFRMEKHMVLQILVNLVRNAMQACEAVGERQKRLTLRLTQEAGRARITVADNGSGITQENLPRIFAHGFTTKKDGHGFGLHSAVLAAKEMDGSLSVQSDGPGRGATFTLDLPMKPGPRHATL